MPHTHILISRICNKGNWRGEGRILHAWQCAAATARQRVEGELTDKQSKKDLITLSAMRVFPVCIHDCENCDDTIFIFCSSRHPSHIAKNNLTRTDFTKERPIPTPNQKIIIHNTSLWHKKYMFLPRSACRPPAPPPPSHSFPPPPPPRMEAEGAGGGGIRAGEGCSAQGPPPPSRTTDEGRIRLGPVSSCLELRKNFFCFIALYVFVVCSYMIWLYQKGDISTYWVVQHSLQKTIL